MLECPLPEVPLQYPHTCLPLLTNINYRLFISSLCYLHPFLSFFLCCLQSVCIIRHSGVLLQVLKPVGHIWQGERVCVCGLVLPVKNLFKQETCFCMVFNFVFLYWIILTNFLIYDKGYPLNIIFFPGHKYSLSCIAKTCVPSK